MLLLLLPAPVMLISDDEAHCRFRFERIQTTRLPHHAFRARLNSAKISNQWNPININFLFYFDEQHFKVLNISSRLQDSIYQLLYLPIAYY
jgi:hypothetical protein